MMDFYDIAMAPPVEERCCSVNPWKARLALNFKAAPYTTKWITLPDIPRVRGDLGVAPCRKHASGESYPTLPVLVDNDAPASGDRVRKVGDSFDIAVYLQETYPDSGAGDLFPSPKADTNGEKKKKKKEKNWTQYAFGQDLADWMPPLSDRNTDPRYDEYSRFNREVDLLFTTHVGLMGYYLPLDTEAAKQEMLKRAGMQSWEQLKLEGEMRETMLNGFRKGLEGLAVIFEDEGRGEGPFIEGDKATYADLILGGWLYMASRTLPMEEWEEVVIKGNGGVFGRLFEALGKWAEVK